MLFGAPTDKEKVKVGGLCFLFDFSEGIIYGPFEATSNSAKNIAPRAFSGKFSWQTRVSYLNNAAKGYYDKGDMKQHLTGSVSRNVFNTVVMKVDKGAKKVPGVLTREQGERLIDALKESGWTPEKIGCELV
jgi:hypothetical protein